MDIWHNSYTIVTHDGAYHADEVVGVAVLRFLNPFLPLMRTRKWENLPANKQYLLLDIGEEYDPEKGRFDHHQREGAGERANGVPYATAGLIWKHFGIQYVQAYVRDATGLRPEPDFAVVKRIVEGVDARFIQGVDAVDCGYKKGERHISGPSHLTFNGFIAAQRMLPAPLGGFLAAVSLAQTWLNALVHQMMEAAHVHDECKEIFSQLRDRQTIVTMPQYAPGWQEHARQSTALFVVFPASNGDGWMCSTVPAFGFPEPKLRFPESWAGETDRLPELSGVPDATFCHRGRFIAGAQSLDGARALAAAAMR